MTANVTTALIYDFDGTLAEGNVQEHSFIPTHDVKTKDFWDDVKREAREQDSDEILVYMHKLLEIAKHKGSSVTKEMLRKHGASTPLFEGTSDWFNRINDYSKNRGLVLEHYIISSGISEMIKGCSIASNFKQIFASKFMYRDDEAIWPGVSINYTTKTQFLFRINKGINNHWDNETINKWVPMHERPVPFSRMIFIGDGETDIPSMKMVRLQGGHSVAVFDPNKWSTVNTKRLAQRLISEDRVNFVVPADYTEDSQLDVTIKGILGKIAREEANYRSDDEE